MAQPVACQFEDGQNAVFVGTFLESGQAVALCTDHLVDFMTVTLQEMTGAPVVDLIAKQLEELSAEGEPAPKTPTPNDGPSPDGSTDLHTADDGDDEHHVVSDKDATAIALAAAADATVADSTPSN